MKDDTRSIKEEGDSLRYGTSGDERILRHYENFSNKEEGDSLRYGTSGDERTLRHYENLSKLWPEVYLLKRDLEERKDEIEKQSKSLENRKREIKEQSNVLKKLKEDLTKQKSELSITNKVVWLIYTGIAISLLLLVYDLARDNALNDKFNILAKDIIKIERCKQ